MAIEISEHGNLLVYDKSYSSEFIRGTLRDRNLNGLRIWDFWDPLPSLDFLADFTFLSALEIACRYDHDFGFLGSMSQLVHFTIGPSATMKNMVDLSNLVNLRYAVIQWRKGKILGLEGCKNLVDLCLIEFKDESLERVEALMKIRRLRIKTGSMQTLKGIESLKFLSEFEVGNCRRLTSMCHLNGLSNLRSLSIESCRNIADYDGLTDLPCLETLRIINCGQIPHINLNHRFPNLSEFRLVGNTRMAKSV